MEKEIKITCPCCDTIIFVDRVRGEIKETREPLIEHSTGDRLADAFIKRERTKEKHAGLFDNMKEAIEKKKREADDLFNSSLDHAKKEKPEKPNSIFDRD